MRDSYDQEMTVELFAVLARSIVTMTMTKFNLAEGQEFLDKLASLLEREFSPERQETLTFDQHMRLRSLLGVFARELRDVPEDVEGLWREVESL